MLRHHRDLSTAVRKDIVPIKHVPCAAVAYARTYEGENLVGQPIVAGHALLGQGPNDFEKPGHGNQGIVRQTVQV